MLLYFTIFCSADLKRTAKLSKMVMLSKAKKKVMLITDHQDAVHDTIDAPVDPVYRKENSKIKTQLA